MIDAKACASMASSPAPYAFTLFVLTALPVSVILDGVDPSHTKESGTRNLDLAADGLNSGGTLLEWFGLLKLGQLDPETDLPVEDNAVITAALVIIIAIFVITCLEQADTRLQPSPDPDTGEEFRSTASNFDDLRAQSLRVSEPAARQWSGWAAEAFTEHNDAQRVRLQQMADADNQLAAAVHAQAAQVNRAREEVAGAKLVLATAIPGAALLYKVNPWASVVWQIVCGVAAITEVVTAYVNLHDKSEHNADRMGKATALYTEVQQSAHAAIPPDFALPEATASFSAPPAASPASSGGPAPQTAVHDAASPTAAPDQRQTLAAAPLVMPARLAATTPLGRASTRPPHATHRKATTALADPLPSVDDAGVGEQSVEPQAPAVPVEAVSQAAIQPPALPH